MLETEEVDVDYFTPASSTSLSKIFSNTTQIEDGQENSSLKYIPPLPMQVTPKPDEEKSTQHVLYVMTINAYEWLKDSYVSKERVGFVIIQIIKSGLHNIILYDSNKTILSCLTLTPKTEVNVKENVSISFYDNLQKYWSVYTTPYEINKILDILKGLKVILKNSDTRKDSENVETVKSAVSKISEQIKNDDKESDTDSSVNRRTKDSILKRMATMGQSVLPPTHLLTTQTSDSSDTNEAINPHKSRHKPFKTINKRNIEKNAIEIDNCYDSQIKTIAPKPIISPDVNKPHNIEPRVVTIKTMDVVKSSDSFVPDGNDMTMFMSEQRVNNSELRINMSRITDKLDLMLDKVKCLESVDKISSGSNSLQIQNEITYKLLNEYEKKIKNYEMFIRSKGFNCDTFEPLAKLNDSENTNYGNEPGTMLSCDCKELCKEKDRQINELKAEAKILTMKFERNKLKDTDNHLITEISELKQHILTQKDEIQTLNKKIEMSQTNEDIINKLKTIMNDTFQTISTNFDNGTNYSGAMIKSTVASVIKKSTMDCLKEL